MTNQLMVAFHMSSTVSVEFTEDKKAKKKLIGLKAGDTLIIDPRVISRSESDLAAMLNISAERAAAYTRNVELKVTDVKSLAPAEVNQELFDKIYGEGTVTTAEDFRLKIESELSGMFVKDSDKVFKRDLTESLVKKLKLTLQQMSFKRNGYFLPVRKKSLLSKLKQNMSNMRKTLNGNWLKIK